MNEKSAQPIRVQQIDHITLIVADLERSRHFYCDILGMEQVARPNFSFNGRWFQAANTLIHVILEHDQSGPAGELCGNHEKTTRNRHFAFAVEHCDQAVDFLKEQGIPIFSGPKTRPDGVIQLFLTDPDGHLVELCSQSVSK